MRLCEYGCGREAKFPPGKGRKKWCCNKSPNSCPEMRKKNSKNNKGKCGYWKGKVGPRKGQHLSEKTRKKISDGNKRKTKGKTYEELYGEEKAKILKRGRSEMMKGENNHMYGRKRTKESITKQSKTMKKNGSTKGERNGMFRRCGKLNPFYKKSHTKEQREKWKKERSIKEYREMMSKLMKKLWTEEWFFKSHTKWSKSDIQNLNEYYRSVSVFTRHSLRKYYDIINPENKPISYYQYHIDHIFSIIDGFKINVEPEIIGNVANLQVLPMKKNLLKNSNSAITLDELLERFKKYEDNI